MKFKLLIFALLLSVSYVVKTQELLLSELQKLCDSQKFGTGNSLLVNKGWEYHDSSKELGKGSIITYAHSKSYSDTDRAAAWLYLYAEDNIVEKVVYLSTETAYKNIIDALETLKYKYVNNEINNQSIETTYRNASFTLIIQTETEKRPYSDATFVKHMITLIKKKGAYDKDNGSKTVFLDDGGYAKYTLVDGVIEGEVKLFYDGGNLKEVFYLKNGERNGNNKYYYENGNLELDGNYLNGELHGILKAYFPDGVIKEERNYKNGKKSGVAKEYYEDGQLFAETNYLNDELHGLVKLHYPDGKLESETYYKNGKLNGKCKIYFENGLLKEERNYLDGNLDGKQILCCYDDESMELLGRTYLYFNNGKMTNQKDYLLDKGKEVLLTDVKYDENEEKHGECIEINEESKQLIYANYIHGELDGLCEVYVEFFFGVVPSTSDKSKLILVEKGEYSEGEKHGYWEEGSLIYKETGNYNNGKRTGVWKTFTHYSHGEVDKETGNISLGYLGQGVDTPADSLVLWLETTYRYGAKNGKEIQYQDGEKIAEREYTADKLNGEYKEYLDGKLIVTGRYSYGDKNGTWISYYIDGSKIKKNYSNGELSGEVIVFDKTPIPRYTFNFEDGVLQKIKGEEFSVEFISANDIWLTYQYNYDAVLNELEIDDEYLMIKEKVLGNKNVIAECRETRDDFDYEDFAVILDNVKILFEVSKPNGVFTLTNKKSQLMLSGELYGEIKKGEWKYYYYDKNICLTVSYGKYGERGVEKYKKLDGIIFSGEFEYVNKEKNIKEIRKIKDGLRNGSTVYIDLRNNKKVKREKYKNGVLK